MSIAIGLITKSPLFSQVCYSGSASSCLTRSSSPANLETANMLDNIARSAASLTDSAFSASLAILSLAQVTRVANRPMARPRARR